MLAHFRCCLKHVGANHITQSSQAYLAQPTFVLAVGESVRVVKPECILIEIATKIGVYNKMRDVMMEAIS